MNDLEKYEKVNKCETLEEFLQVLESFLDKEGNIQGRNRKFDGNKMINNAKLYYNDEIGFILPNVVTREFGLDNN